MNLKVGDKVVKVWKKFDRYADNVSNGTVIAEPTNDALTGNPKVYVQWDSKWYKPNPEEVEISRLMTKEDSDAQYSKLEKEFDALEEKVKDKLAEAGKLIKEANAIAETGGFQLTEFVQRNGCLWLEHFFF